MVNSIKNKFKSLNKENVIRLILNNKAILIFVALLIFVTILRGSLFYQSINISSLLRSIAVILLVGLGNTLILATGSVDLSAGNMLSLLGVIYGLSINKYSLLVSIIIVIICGALFGILNGALSQFLKLPPFITTLAVGQIYLGFSYVISGGRNISGITDAAKFIGQGSILPMIPFSFLIVLLVFLILNTLVKRTKYGRHVIATGGNARAATLTGVNVKKIKISAYFALGITVALAAIVLTGRAGLATPTAGSGLEMDAISAVVIGGTSMAGGKANVLGTIFGAFVIGMITNLLNLTSVNPFYQYIAKGVIIIIAIGLDVLTGVILSKTKKNALATQAKKNEKE